MTDQHSTSTATPERMNWYENQLHNASKGGIVILAFILNGVAILMGLLGLLLCKNKEARSNAWALIIFGVAVSALAGALLFVILQK